MSENTQTENTLKLPGIFAFKEGMATIYGEKGEAIPVTVLRYEPWVVTQVKTPDSDGYSAVQISCMPLKKKNSSAAISGHAKKAGHETGFRYSKEIRVKSVDGLTLGAQVDMNSLAKGDSVQMTGVSKGRGFTGVMKRWNFGGGPASHGSKFHRIPGSVGNRTWPGRVMPGKKLPGHFGSETVSMKNVEVVDVNSDSNTLFIKGGVPGARNSLVRLLKR